MGFPTEFYHVPVGFVSVHGNLHSSAAGSDFTVEIGVIQLRKFIFKFFDICHSACCGNVSAVKQNVNAAFFNAVLFCTGYHRKKMLYMRVNVAVAEKSEEMESRVVFFAVRNKFFPDIGSVHTAAFDGFVYKFCALRINLSAAESVMSDLAVSHIVIGRKSDRRAVSLYLCPRIGSHERIQRRLICRSNGIAVFFVRDTYAVHNDEYNFFVHIFKYSLLKIRIIFLCKKR